MLNLNRILSLFKNLKNDFGKIGFASLATMIAPMIGSALLLGLIYQIGPWLRENNEIGVVLFIVFMAILSGFALLATNILGIVSGFAFDLELGIVAQILGIAGASSIMFFSARKFASGNMLSMIEKKPKLKAISYALLNENKYKTLLLVILIRLSPAMPFALTNFLMSASGVSFKSFIFGTFLGMLPRSSAIVFIGSSLSELSFSTPQESWVLILGIIATIAACIFIGILSKRALDNLMLNEAALDG